MRRSMVRIAVGLLVAGVLWTEPAAWSWGNTGHEAVACAAWKLLDQATKDKIWALLQRVPTRQNAAKTKSIAGFPEWTANLPAGLSDDEQHMWVFMRAATYPDSLKHTFLHDSDVVPSNMAEATANLGFTDPDSHGYWHFVDEAFGTAATANSKPPSFPTACLKKNAAGNLEPPPTPVSTLPPTPAVNAESEIELLSQKMAGGEDPDLMAYDLMWLEHLVGDIHQPLHAAVRYVNGVGDTGGNCVEIKIPSTVTTNFKDASGKSKKPTELHAFWDDLPGAGEQMDTQMALDYAATLPAADADLAKVTDPKTWLSESFALAQSDAYASPIGKALGSPTAYVITQAYYDAAAGDAQKRIALAGARLAGLLTGVMNSGQ
ncbi:S1/P1 nuclease [Acidobacteria bacterium AB60]|nr:S1/P1 nuclease [Acidobacteria bacterium AB60]